MSINTITASTSSVAGRIAPALLSVFFGLFVVGFVGFSPMEVVHNAAHDARHANAFPCH
ncbi:cobalt transporter [Rhizobium sp. KAs_5_22]|uniref:CbtB domain-containing protein n=1 Tax=Ciceribacter selenitireducens TaxID=448181 RepID=UPI0004BA248B|nr:CbtB-domain containing protein [Ciceribacter selenitireducens]PPJ47268.1 cobalt transporter [Rhizobium sp. KAs_5_22]